MTYFVTGATGFIGRHLLEKLLLRKGRIYCLVRKESLPKFNDLCARQQRVEPGRRLHSLHAVRFRVQALVDLQNRDDVPG